MTQTLVIFDTEFTAWPGSAERGWSADYEYREIIQLAAVKVEVGEQGATITETFNELVLPTINKVLSDYIVDLTGISQEMINQMGIDYTSCFKQFTSFVGDDSVPCLSWGNDRAVLIENCQMNDCLDIWKDFHFVNLRNLITQKEIPGGNVVSGELAHSLGIELHGHVHNALHDVRSITLAMEYWLNQSFISIRDLVPSE